MFWIVLNRPERLVLRNDKNPFDLHGAFNEIRIKNHINFDLVSILLEEKRQETVENINELSSKDFNSFKTIINSNYWNICTYMLYIRVSVSTSLYYVKRMGLACDLRIICLNIKISTKCGFKANEYWLKMMWIKIHFVWNRLQNVHFIY